MARVNVTKNTNHIATPNTTNHGRLAQLLHLRDSDDVETLRGAGFNRSLNILDQAISTKMRIMSKNRRKLDAGLHCAGKSATP
jgi:hypothetical protein